MTHPLTTSLLLATITGTFTMHGCDKDDDHQETAPSSSLKIDTAPWFENKSGPSGVDFNWISGAQGEFNLPEIIGGGIAMIDYDNDGDLDLYFVQGGQLVNAIKDPLSNDVSDKLYRNDGDFKFTDVTEAALPSRSVRGYGMCPAVGDYDNDGDTDIYIANLGRNTLLRNDDGQFTDVTEMAGLGDDGWGSAAAFLDIDLDGDLDLYSGNYLEWSPETEITCHATQGGEDYCAPTNYPTPAIDRLYLNLGDGRFKDITRASGIASNARTALGISIADYDQNGFPDIFIANDGMPDTMWSNQGNGRFVDTGLQSGCSVDNDGQEKAGMGVGSTDMDDDGDIDLLVCNLGGESDSLFRNDGDHFTDLTARSGIKTTTSKYTRFGLGWVDFNNDGYLDLYEATGRVQRAGESVSGDDPYAEMNILLSGKAGDRMSLRTPVGGVANQKPRTSRGAAFGDLDDDGKIDIIVINKDAAANVYRNINEEKGRWMLIKALDRNGRDAIGAKLTVKAGDRRITRMIHPAGSYYASNDPRAHLGLGPITSVEYLDILWPDGSKERFDALETNRVHTIRQGEGRAE
ncbi:MAG: hypothetical protein CMJ40_04610 [Phycisphaerae bacterium]|nr:hypothetical protein [Phycisphaerae bacterium]|tara:strand:- start:635 stop:2359 length:1725 start_codon:yes stop_codon:yes gene_type:complete